MNRFKFRVFAPLISEYNYFDLAEVIKVNTDYVIQQCLGVQDKNSRYIYEGDVVKFVVSEYNDPEISKVTSLLPAIGEIVWCSNSAAFRAKTIQQGRYRYQDEYLPELGIYNYDEEMPLYFYCPYEGYQEFDWNELEVIGSIADEYFIALDHTISKLTTPEELLQQLK